MPPVLGPVSPSPMRLKSRAGASGSARSPSQSASTDSSSPRRNSSTSTGWSPKRRSSSIATSAACASRLVLRDHDALARREAVGLDHGGVGVDRLQPLVDRAHDPVAAGRHAGRLHHLLGVDLRALEPRGLAPGPKHGHRGGPQRVDEPGDERRLRPDDDEVDARVDRRAGQRARGRRRRRRAPPPPRGSRRCRARTAARGAAASARARGPARARGRRRRRRGPAWGNRRGAQSEAMKSSIGIAASDS